MRFTKKLKVLPNPWRSLDEVGRPNCACPVDPDDNPGRAWVGATLCPVQTRVIEARPRGDLRSNVQQTVYRFDEQKVVEVPVTQHYLQAIRGGSLVAADRETASKAGLKFEEPHSVQDRAKRDAVATFDANYGAGAWASLAEDRDRFKTPLAPVTDDHGQTEEDEPAAATAKGASK